MLPDRIDAVARNMPRDIRRWFIESEYAKPSYDHQDWDLMLAHWDYVPLLIEYCENIVNPLEKRFEAFSALMVLQSSGADRPEDDRKRVTHEIERIVLANRDFAHKACNWVGVTESLRIKQMLGEELPADIPQWMHDEIKRNT
jgi:hypothetical protein